MSKLVSEVKGKRVVSINELKDRLKSLLNLPESDTKLEIISLTLEQMLEDLEESSQ